MIHFLTTKRSFCRFLEPGTSGWSSDYIRILKVLSDSLILCINSLKACKLLRGLACRKEMCPWNNFSNYPWVVQDRNRVGRNMHALPGCHVIIFQPCSLFLFSLPVKDLCATESLRWNSEVLIPPPSSQDAWPWIKLIFFHLPWSPECLPQNREQLDLRLATF